MTLKSKFCPKCGKETKILIEGLCTDCYYKKNPIKIPREISLTICRRCDAIRYEGKWIKTESWKHYLTELLIKKIKLPKKIKLDNIKIVKIGEEGKIRLWLAVDDDIFTESRNISIVIHKKLCNECSKKKSKQWNSKIQLRADDVLINKILKILPREHIIKIRPVRNGVDILFSDKNKGKALAKKIKSKYDLSSKTSFEQRGWDITKNTSYKMSVILLKKE